MKAASFASLLLACVLSPVASDPCLAPICVVNKLCAPTLPSCVRFKEGVTTFKWINITGNAITGQTDAETKLNLHLKLAEGSCQMTIRVVSAHEAKSFRDFCDYERSNASLRAFNEIGQKYRVESAQELRQMMSDGIPSSVELNALSVSTERTISEASSTTTAVGETRSSPNDAMLSTSTVKTKIVDSRSSPSSAKLPRTTTMAPGRGPSSAVEKKTTSSAPVRPKDIKSSTSKTTSDVVLVDDDPQIELDRAYVVVEVSFGEIFEFQLGSDDTFRLQETSPGTRVVVERGLAVGFTIFTEQQETNEFRVLSSSGRLLIFALHPVNQAERSLEKQQANHRFITESRKPELDLIKSLNHIRKVAGVETVVILDANSTHIIWIIEKNTHEPLFTTTGSLETMAEGMDDEYVITRFELRLTTGDHVYAIMRRTLQIFLIIFLPMFLTFMPVIWYLKKKHGKKCSCSKLSKPSPQ